MKPLVRALNILQSETNTHMGWLLPTIYQLEVKLKRMATANNVKVCLPLVQAIQQGIQKRFGEMMQDPELIATSILLPKFKTSWTDNADIIQRGELLSTFMACGEKQSASVIIAHRKPAAPDGSELIVPVPAETGIAAAASSFRLMPALSGATCLLSRQVLIRAASGYT
ncbi:hypothetical protein AAFF_G00323000 [Aldrovandia affinis]|uniref:Uncharacterized protein n=1 Tax=Aldrovandia affinis TaxID=143900 RepID=A0AAD7SMB3_9TELE|nr:hypothetical protein AAFF_G00323000 [Aldrovandia affinis]